jgi:ankyrin repeat protein
MRKKLLQIIFLATLHSGIAHAGAYDEILADAEHNRTEAVLELLQLGLDVNTAAPDGTTLLMTAARNGNLGLIEALLKNRANHLIRNRYGDTALMFAALNGHVAAVKRLLELGGPQENRDGWAPLHYAAFQGHIEVARYLLGKGARVNVPAPNTQTALMLAAGSGNMEMVRFLIDEQADMRLKDRDGKTARDIAAAKGHKQIADYMASFDTAEK